MRILYKFQIALAVFGLFCATGCTSRSHTQKQPVIGITCNLLNNGPEPWSGYITVNYSYIEAVRESGAIPVILPMITDEHVLHAYIEKFDGLILVGGGIDIPPQSYGSKTPPTSHCMSTKQYESQRKLIEEWLKTGKPILGICLGMQFANVCRGGTLLDDIPTQIGTSVIHRDKSGGPAIHSVKVIANTKLHTILGKNAIDVRSVHHQAIDRLGNGLICSARSDDGVIEAAEIESHRFGIFLQWHPESMNDVCHRKAIYGAFVKACYVP